MATGSHSSYNALQTSVTQNASRIGLSFQASYTFSKSIDDTSVRRSSSGVLHYLPQDPRNPGADRGPSSFDVTHGFSVSLIQSLPFDRVAFLKPLGKYVTGGWQFLNITSLSSGPPFYGLLWNSANRRWRRWSGSPRSCVHARFFHQPGDA